MLAITLYSLAGCAKVFKMHFLTVSLAVGLHFSLLSYCVPATTPSYSLLDPQTLALVRANAISISTERSVLLLSLLTTN